jgi:hypothetical protein
VKSLSRFGKKNLGGGKKTFLFFAISFFALSMLGNVVVPTTSEAGLPDGLFLKPKIPIWVNFGGSCKLQWKILVYGQFGNFSGHFVYFMALWFMYFVVIWYIFPVLVYCTTKNLATLV